MNIDQYGPFAQTVAVAGALVATFSIFLIKMFGRTKNWTWLAAYSPQGLVTIGARIIAVALMAITFMIIDETNYIAVGIIAILIAFWGVFQLIRFNHLRMVHTVSIPVVNSAGNRMTSRNRPVEEIKIIGAEGNMRQAALAAYTLHQQQSATSVANFMSGYGTPPNNPELIWDRELLASISNKLTLKLIYVVLAGVFALFAAALAIEVFMGQQSAN